MSGFHLEGPWLTTNGKKKGKRKFRNADAAKKSREAQDFWSQKLKEWDIKPKKKFNPIDVYQPSKVYHRGQDQARIPSLESTWEPCTKNESQKYTGDKMIGIATMAKSNSIPVFSQEQAIEVAKMRRG